MPSRKEIRPKDPDFADMPGFFNGIAPTSDPGDDGMKDRVERYAEAHFDSARRIPGHAD